MPRTRLTKDHLTDSWSNQTPIKLSVTNAAGSYMVEGFISSLENQSKGFSGSIQARDGAIHSGTFGMYLY